jgi:unsaturated chondroitin disaccharide hydrolase
MKQKFISCIVITIGCAITCFSQNVKYAEVFNDIEKQTRVLLQEIAKVSNGKRDLESPRTVEKGELKMVSSRDWTSGFFPGELWFLYEYSGKLEWKQWAEGFTANIEKEKTNAGTHDMGFKVYCSFGNGYRLAPNLQYKDVIIQSAMTLSTRFNPITGCIRSWDNNRDKWGYPVIIDNMMNLELLFAATKLTGDSSFYKIAVTHANTTMQNHYRPDHSSYHVVDYDTVTGKVVKKNTHQGYADESAWARGQSWGLYGYAMCYRFTKNKKYLKQAEDIASFLLNHPNLPEDYIPYWDYNAPNIPDEKRDASAAAILASGLYELSTYSKNGKVYKERADKIIESLTHNYRSPPAENKGFILMHSVGHMPNKSEIDVPIDYADYYYIEALLRGKKLKEKKKLW